MIPNESNAALRRVFLELTIDDGVTPATDADVAAPAGTIQICVNGASFVNGGGSFTRIASNLYYYELTLAECVRGFTAVKFSRAGYHGEIEIDFIGDVFALGEANTAYLRYPIVIFGDDPQPPIPATGATVTAGDLQISTNGGAFVNATGTMPEVGAGLYYYQGVVPNAAARARLVVKYTHTSFAMAAVSIDVESSTAAAAPIAPISPPPAAPASQAASADANFYGTDIWFDVSVPDPVTGQANYVITPDGDVTTVTGPEALRQSLIRRTITNPGEWKYAPEYGCGARMYVKGKNTSAKRTELESRIRAQYLRDNRVLSVDLVTVSPLPDGSPGIKISARVTPKGRLRGDQPLTVQIEVR